MQQRGADAVDAGRVARPERLAALSASMRAEVAAGGMLGAAWLVAQGGQLCWRETVGCVAPGRPAQLEDRYLWMSLSKPLTAMLVLRAVADGRFALNTPVADVLPAFAAAGKADIAVHHLLTHCAGMPPGLVPEGCGLTPEATVDLAQCVAAVAAQPASAAPGASVRYSPTAGYAVLGQLLVATDTQRRSFRALAHDRLFAPLGMTGASFGLSVTAPERVPAACAPVAESPAAQAVAALLNRVLDARAELPGGGAFGTLMDAYRWTECVRAHWRGAPGVWLAPAGFAQACQSQTGQRPNEGWRTGAASDADLPPAHYNWLGGQTRGHGRHLSAAGTRASAQTVYAVGRGTTFWLYDPVRDLTFVMLSAGILPGRAHIERLSAWSDLALAACESETGGA